MCVCVGVCVCVCPCHTHSDAVWSQESCQTQSCHTRECRTNVNEAWHIHTCEWVMSHVNESCTCNHRARPPRSMVPRIANESRPMWTCPIWTSHVAHTYRARPPRSMVLRSGAAGSPKAAQSQPRHQWVFVCRTCFVDATMSLYRSLYRSRSTRWRQKLRNVNFDTNGYSYVAHIMLIQQCLFLGLCIGLVLQSGAKSSLSTPMGVCILHILCWFNNVFV